MFSHFVRTGSFLFNFDLSKGYHHADIFAEHLIYLGFSWKRSNKESFYVFTVLTFGLSSAPGVFTKLLRPLVSVWHKDSINISVYTDDGAGIEYTL